MSRVAVAAGYLLALALIIVVGAFVSTYVVFLLVPLVLGGAATLFFRRRKHSKQSPGLVNLLVGNTLILLFLLSLIFLAFETYYRFICDQTDAMADTLVSTDWYQR